MGTSMKIFFIASAAGTVYLMFVKFKATYDGNHDTFRVEFLLGPVALLALVLNHEFSVMEILWTFSIYLESVAILPQLFMVQRPAKQRRSLAITCSPSAPTALSTSSTGSTATTLRDSMTSSPLWLVSFRPFFTATSSTCTSPRLWPGRRLCFQPRNLTQGNIKMKSLPEKAMITDTVIMTLTRELAGRARQGRHDLISHMSEDTLAAPLAPAIYYTECT